jgi:hypothetical protein
MCALSYLRWAARIAGLLVVLAFGYLIIGELLSSPTHGPNHVREWLGIALIANVLFGMLLAWKYELTGALVSLLALAIFVPAEHMRRFGVVAVLAVPGTLFLIDHIVRRFTLDTRS